MFLHSGLMFSKVMRVLQGFFLPELDQNYQYPSQALAGHAFPGLSGIPAALTDRCTSKRSTLHNSWARIRIGKWLLAHIYHISDHSVGCPSRPHVNDPLKEQIEETPDFAEVPRSAYFFQHHPNHWFGILSDLFVLCVASFFFVASFWDSGDLALSWKTWFHWYFSHFPISAVLIPQLFMENKMLIHLTGRDPYQA